MPKPTKSPKGKKTVIKVPQVKKGEEDKIQLNVTSELKRDKKINPKDVFEGYKTKQK